MKKKQVTVFAPATVSNLAVGFDILGCAFDALGDEITVSCIDQPCVEIGGIYGVEKNLPSDPAKNTATAGLLKMIADLKLRHGFKVSIHKGIPRSSGMGGSAASAVGAVVAANHLLEKPLSKQALLEYALAGEIVASGSIHSDNIAPCLFGGLTLILGTEPPQVVFLPIPKGLFCVLVHPELEISTKEARAVLRKDIALSDYVRQSSFLAGFVAGCFRSDFSLLKAVFQDHVIEPQRASLIRGFHEVRDAALKAGALGCSISGSGPSVFAWASSQLVAKKIKLAMVLEFKKARLESTAWITKVGTKGARVLNQK